MDSSTAYHLPVPGDSDYHSSGDGIPDDVSMVSLLGPLADRNDFPTFEDIPWKRAASHFEHGEAGNSVGRDSGVRPKRHWCFLSEPVRCQFGHERRLTEVRDVEGNRAYVEFYFDNYAEFDFRAMDKIDHTLAIMYASRENAMDADMEVVEVERPEYVKVFPIALEELEELITDVHHFTQLGEDGCVECHACDRRAPPPEMHRCGKCMHFYYCNRDCQIEDWTNGGHKRECKVLRDPCFQHLVWLDFHTYKEPLSFKEAATRPATTPPARVLKRVEVLERNPVPPSPGVPPSSPAHFLAISLSQVVPRSMENKVLKMLQTKAETEAGFEFTETADIQTTLHALRRPPSVVLITDEELTRHMNRRVWEAVVEYVHTGGTAVLMGFFSSFVKPNYLEGFFRQAGLKWPSGSYQRTTVALNQNAVPESLRSKLPASYSQTAMFLKNVDPVTAWYTPTDDSRTESLVFAPQRISDQTQTPVAFAKIGEGSLGYVGDVNWEDETHDVVLAMCRLADRQ